jgi:transcriptional regulator with XRE-family HTH domain
MTDGIERRPYPAIHVKIKAARKSKGWKQLQLAEAAGGVLSQWRIGELEYGRIPTAMEKTILENLLEIEL